MTDRDLLESILVELQSNSAELKSLREEVKSNSAETKLIREEVKSNSAETKSLREEVKSNSAEMKSLREEVKSIRVQQQEDHLILKALEHSAQVNKAEHDKMANDIAHIQGNVKNIAENIDAVKEIIGRHEVDLKVLKNRSV
ncbi:hypothetical protein [Sporanaerobacter acetigenes]|uniref:hypothetical protein n=1 Tax=Sporanaerobacter acetigenes TaxID=165813 RepID=UPI0033187840